MGSLWTVAHHTLREALRMRVVLAFAVLLLAVVAGMPFAVYRDDALSSAMIQTFLAWTLMPVGAILSLLAIFLGSLSISQELVQRQIFLLLSKPLPRWRYVLGKWLGVVWVLTGLLVLAGVAIYGVVRLTALRHNPDPIDPYTLRHQVLTARASAMHLQPDITAEVERTFQSLVEQGRFTDETRTDALKVKADIAKERLAWLRTVPPGEYRVYEFSGVVLPQGARDTFDIELLDVPLPAREEVIKAVAELTHHGTAGAARLLEKLPQSLGQRLPRERAREMAERLTAAGATVVVRDGYLLQLRYKARGLGYLPDETLATGWHFGPTPELAGQNPPIMRKDVHERYHVVDFPARWVGEDGRVFAVVMNLEGQRQDRPAGHPGATLQFESGGLEVLYIIGTFEGNLLRTLFLTWCRVVLIAGVAVFAATLLSFPVACLVAFLFYILAVCGDYVTSALQFGAPGSGTLGPAQYVIQPALEAAFWALPKFAAYDGVENLVDGRNVSLMWDILAFGKLVGLLTTGFLLAACIVFQRRQVAELSI